MFHKECHGGKLEKDIYEGTQSLGLLRTSIPLKTVHVIELSCTRCNEKVIFADKPKTIKRIIMTALDGEKRRITDYTRELRERRKDIYHTAKINIYVVQKEIEATEEPEIQSKILKDSEKTEEKTEEIYCPYCGEQLMPGGSYCAFCGTNIEERIKELEKFQLPISNLN